MTVEAIIETYACPTPRKTLPGKFVGFWGLTHEIQPELRPWEDVVALYDIHGDLIVKGVYEGFSNPKNEGLGHYSIETIVTIHKKEKRTGEYKMIPAVPMRVERIGKVYNCGKKDEQIVMR